MEYDGLITKPTLEELYHHGIKGQKWGVKNGPPYPLDSSVSTGHKLKTKEDLDNSVSTGHKLKTKEDLDNLERKYLELYKRQGDLTNKLEDMGIERHYTKEGRAYSKELKRVNEELNSDEYRNISDLRTSRDLIQHLIKSGKTADYWAEDSDRSNADYYQIQSTIKNVIGNWYESDPHTKSFAEGLEKINKAYNAMTNESRKNYHAQDYSKSAMAREETLRKKYLNAEKDLIGAVLKDMGLPDTPSNREFLYYIVIDD